MQKQISEVERRANRLALVNPLSAEMRALPCKTCARRMIKNCRRLSKKQVDKPFSGEVVCCHLKDRSSYEKPCEGCKFLGETCEPVPEELAEKVTVLAAKYGFFFSVEKGDDERRALDDAVAPLVLNKKKVVEGLESRRV